MLLGRSHFYDISMFNFKNTAGQLGITTAKLRRFVALRKIHPAVVFKNSGEMLFNEKDVDALSSLIKSASKKARVRQNTN